MSWVLPAKPAENTPVLAGKPRQMGKTPSFRRADRSGAAQQQRQSGAAERLMFRPTLAGSSGSDLSPEELPWRPAYLDGGDATVMAPTALEQFLAHVQADPALRKQVSEAITADEVSLLAQDLGYPVSGSDLLRFSGRSVAGVRVTRIDHPGEYPGRYV
jgi:predicted ribosomally synthesized peptide with nif11-like leader